MTSLPERAGRRCFLAIQPLHSTVYFSPALGSQLAPYGIDDWHAAYFATRAAPLGAVGAGAVTAAFYTFSHAVVSRYVPEVWESASPETVLAARLRAVDSTLRRLLGDETAGSGEMAEAARLALRAAEACTRPGRPLFAANAGLPVPPVAEAPHLALWHATTLLREHRGDAHIAVLQTAELDPLEAQVSDTAGGRGLSPGWALYTRGYNEQDWAAAQQRLAGRGLLDAEGRITEAGTALRAELEAETDRLDRAPYEHLGAEGVERLTGLVRGFTATAVAAGAFPESFIGTE